jgi:ketosteroid isomerase-like protein
MSEENVESVRRVYEAVGRRDTETVLGHYDPEVEWDFSRGPLAGLIGPGIYRGHEGLRRWFRDYYEAWETLEHNCDELIDAGEHVVAVAIDRGRGRASGVEVELHYAGVWTIRDGKIVRVVWFPTRDEALEAAGLEE